MNPKRRVILLRSSEVWSSGYNPPCSHDGPIESELVLLNKVCRHRGRRPKHHQFGYHHASVRKKNSTTGSMTKPKAPFGGTRQR